MIAVEKLHPSYVIDLSGLRVSIIFPIEEYRLLVEDIGDLAVVAARCAETTITHEKVLDELMADGFQS